MPQDSTPLPASAGRAPGRRTGPPQHTTPPLWVRPLADWQRWLRAAGRPDTTVYMRVYHVRRFARSLPQDTSPWKVRELQLIDWLGSRDWQAETLRAHRASLRVFYTWAHACDLVAADPTARLPRVQPPRALPRPAPDRIIREALAAAPDRERLMVMLGALAGLRRAEIAAVRHEDVEWDDVSGSWWLRVRGKGQHVRRVPLDTPLADTLLALPGGYAFPNPYGGHLTPAHVGKLISRVLPEGWTTHKLRHRFGTRIYAAERDLLVTQALMGHRRPETTMVYVAVPDRAMRAAVAAAGRLRGQGHGKVVFHEVSSRLMGRSGSRA